MDIIGFAILVVGMTWGGIFLVINNHPWWAVLVFIMVVGARYRSTDNQASQNAESED